MNEIPRRKTATFIHRRLHKTDSVVRMSQAQGLKEDIQRISKFTKLFQSTQLLGIELLASVEVP